MNTLPPPSPPLSPKRPSKAPTYALVVLGIFVLLVVVAAMALANRALKDDDDGGTADYIVEDDDPVYDSDTEFQMDGIDYAWGLPGIRDFECNAYQQLRAAGYTSSEIRREVVINFERASGVTLTRQAEDYLLDKYNGC